MHTVRTRPSAIAAAVGALLFLASAPSTAQVVGRTEGREVTPNGGYVVNAKPGLPTTRLSVWGQVVRPGVYEVGPDFDLATVVALAGGPRELSFQERNLGLRIEVYRGGDQIYAAPADAIGLDPSALPEIRDGDVAVVAPDRSVRVNVWGTVMSPGLVVLGPNDTVSDAISLAGGPRTVAIVGNNTRTVELTVTRGTTGRVLYDGALTDLPPSIADQGLQDGDILMVEVRDRVGWQTRDTLTVAGIAVSSVLAITQIFRVFQAE